MCRIHTKKVSHSYECDTFLAVFLKKNAFSLVFYEKNGYAQFEPFCAASVEWKSLHSVGEQPSFVLKIR